jgi:hypothetical protein
MNDGIDNLLADLEAEFGDEFIDQEEQRQRQLRWQHSMYLEIAEQHERAAEQCRAAADAWAEKYDL